MKKAKWDSKPLPVRWIESHEPGVKYMVLDHGGVARGAMNNRNIRIGSDGSISWPDLHTWKWVDYPVAVEDEIYETVKVRVEGKVREIGADRLVLLAFRPPACDVDALIVHHNRNFMDRSLDNLCWVDDSGDRIAGMYLYEWEPRHKYLYEMGMIPAAWEC